jgi:hypothetical protein
MILSLRILLSSARHGRALWLFMSWYKIPDSHLTMNDHPPIYG